MLNLYQKLQNLLLQEKHYTQNGKLLKNKIVTDALRLAPTLLQLLLQDEQLKKHFFQEVASILIFDKIKFQQFINNKQFLPSSYTQFKNKIGLTSNGTYLIQRKEVVLSWAYKDAVLQGGQTRADQKRPEIFWNETLAPDEIDRLFEPKVLVNWKKYDKNGVHQATEISLKDNLLIKGNNLLALHTLKKVYTEKVKLIYIDPPFNTGNDSFQYNDTFKHSTWLTFMKNRLEVAKTLLRTDGLIFIHIDDIEAAYLQVLCDEIFGRDNFINVIAVKSSTPSGTKTAHKNRTIIKQKDLILVYKKGGTVRLNPQYFRKTKWDSHYSLFLTQDTAGNYQLQPLITVLLEQKIIDKKISIKAIDINHPKFKLFYLANADKICRLQSHKNKAAKAASSEKGKVVYEHIENGISKGLFFNGQVITPLAQGIKKVYHNQRFVKDLGMLLCDFWADIDFQNTQNEGKVRFPTAKKPEFLLSRIIELSTQKGDIVLDFFLGSGTTAAVALKSNRQFIGIEQLDYGVNDSVQRLQYVLNGEQSGVSKAYDWQGGGHFIYAELANDNQQFIDAIAHAEDTTALHQIWKKMQVNGFLDYRVELNHVDNQSFDALSFKEKQLFLVEILDKNALYINYCDLHNADYELQQYDIEMTKKFYNDQN